VVRHGEACTAHGLLPAERNWAPISLQSESENWMCCAVKKGDRIAQLILERIMTPEVEEVEDLDATLRGAGGYGSTGVAS
jgi:hypothetical protein